MVLPDPVVEPVPGCLPRLGDLRGLAIVGDQRPCFPVGAGLTWIVALRLEAPLDDLVGIKGRVRRVLAVLIDGEELADLARGVVIPRDRRAVGHGVVAVPVVRRLVQAGLLEQLGPVEQDRGIDRERDARLSLATNPVEVDGRLRELGHVVLALVDERLQVEPLAVERVRAADAHRTHDVRPRARGELDGQRVRCAGIGHRHERQVDARVGCVERIGHLLLDLDLLDGVAAAEAAVPDDLDVTRLAGGRSGDRGGAGRGGCVRRRAGRGPRRCPRRAARRRARPTGGGDQRHERQQDAKASQRSIQTAPPHATRFRSVDLPTHGLAPPSLIGPPDSSSSVGPPPAPRSSGSDRHVRRSVRTRPDDPRRWSRCLR